MRLLYFVYVLSHLSTFNSCNIFLFSEYGEGYAWNPQTVEISQGDFVKWTWTTPDFVTGIGYTVQETDSPTATVYNSVGFTSGSVKSANGLYKFRAP